MTTRRTLYLPVMIAAAVLLVCAAALLAGSQKAEATFRSQNGKIAYASYDGNDYEIYTINAGGGNKLQVTNNDKNNLSPSYSSSGEKLAYECYAGIDTDICTISVRGGGKFNVTKNDTDDFNPDYSPDGNRIAYQGPDHEIHTIKVGGEGSPESPTAMRPTTGSLGEPSR